MSHTDKDVPWRVTRTNPSFWVGEEHRCRHLNEPCSIYDRIARPWGGCRGILPYELQRKWWTPPSRADRHNMYWRPDRAHTRDALRKATKRYRAGEDLDDITLVDQHRRGVFGGGYMD